MPYTKKPTERFVSTHYDLNKYELVLLVARRARQINAIRVNLQKQHNIPLIEKDKPTNYALREVFGNKVGYEYAKTVVEEEPTREIQKF